MNVNRIDEWYEYRLAKRTRYWGTDKTKHKTLDAPYRTCHKCNQPRTFYDNGNGVLECNVCGSRK